jgi:hypothetical protein
MLGSFNNEFYGLQLQKSGLVPVTADNWCTNGGYGAGTDVEVLLQLWLAALGVLLRQHRSCLSNALGLNPKSLKVTTTGDVKAIDQHQLGRNHVWNEVAEYRLI